MSCSLSLIIVLSFVCIVKRTTGLRLELTNVNFLRPNVKLVFTKILNVVQLFGKPTVVIVTVQPLYCCYCSTPVQLPIFDRNSAKTLRSALFRFSRVFNAILRRFQAIFESIEIKGKQSGLPPAGLTLGGWSQVLAYCCSRGLLFTSVVHQAHCCSAVTVNNKNIVQKLTFGNPNHVIAQVHSFFYHLHLYTGYGG